MRKYIRNLIRADAKRRGIKASRYVRSEFGTHQVKKYGYRARLINQAKGTHKRRIWRSRISLINKSPLMEV